MIGPLDPPNFRRRTLYYMRKSLGIIIVKKWFEILDFECFAAPVELAGIAQPFYPRASRALRVYFNPS
jgi:hypothetical protein